MGDWTFLSNYGHVLVCLARNREARLREVAERVGITERAVQKIVRDLQDEGYLTVTKQGRCNRYRINRRKSLRHALESHRTVGKLLTLLTQGVQAGSEAEQDSAEPSAKAPAPPTIKPAPTGTEAEERPAGDNTESGKQPPAIDPRQQGSLF